MKKLVYSICLFLLLFNCFTDVTFAVVNPLSSPNNKYGIHIIDENDLENAAALVNSSGGDWGYVTIVLPENERKVDKWNALFDRMRQYHLIPLIRIATTINGSYWNAPTVESAEEWVSFLSQLRWVTKNRYIILFNEPNHAKEWGGKVDPKEYAQIIKTFSTALKTASEDFFVLSAGFDASAPTASETLDEVAFLKQGIAAETQFFDFIDGWSSHSYPNPGFRGLADDKGRGSLQTFQWEIKLLHTLGLKKELPIFITETGWPHSEGVFYNSNFHDTNTIADFISDDFVAIFDEPNIAAITPFVLNYQSYPFIHFSWQKQGSDSFYPQFDSYRSIPKIAGIPAIELPQINRSELVNNQPNDLERREVNNLKKPAHLLLNLASAFADILHTIITRPVKA